MTCTLTLGKGEPTDKTLGELVGHVVTVGTRPHLVVPFHCADKEIAFRISIGMTVDDLIGAIDLEQPISSPRPFDKRMRPNLDHGPLTVSTDAPVCRPKIEAIKRGDMWHVDINGHVNQSMGDEMNARGLAEGLDLALSHLRTEAEVRAEAIEEVCKYLETDSSLEDRVYASIIRKNFLPTPPQDHTKEREPAKAENDKGKWCLQCGGEAGPNHNCFSKPAEPATVTVEMDEIVKMIDAEIEHCKDMKFHEAKTAFFFFKKDLIKLAAARKETKQ